MADRIYVTYTPTTAPGTYHATIHYERTGPAGDVVEHVTIEAEPENLEKLSASDKAIGVVEEVFRTNDAPSRFGRIDAYVRERKASHDPDAPYEIIAEGDDLSANLARMRLFAHAVNGSGFAYRGDRQNSNSFAGGALQAGELPPATGVAHDPAGPPGELLEFFAPGLNEPLRAPIGPRREPGEVARGSFDNRFGKWASSPASAALAPGFGDPESLNGRFGNWASVPVGELGDTRSPVLRALEKYRTSAAPDGPVSTSAQGLPAMPAFRPAGTGGVLGKFVEDGVITPGGQYHHPCPCCRGPRHQILRTRNLRIRSCGGSALLFPTSRRVTLSNWERRRSPLRCWGYSAASRYCRFRMRYGVWRIDPAHLPAAPCPIYWPALAGEIQLSFRRMTTHADLIATSLGGPGSSKASARRRTARDCRRHGQNFIDNFSTHLTRRANHRHIFIIARIQKPAPGNRPRAFAIRVS